MSENILAVTELKNNVFRKASFEVISAAKRIASSDARIGALIMGSGLSGLSSIPAKYGANTVFVADHEKLASYLAEYYAEIILEAVKILDAKVILLPATLTGKDLAPRVAARLGAGLASDCLSLAIENGSFIAERPLYAGKAIAKVAVKSAVKMATLRPNIFPVSESDPSTSAEIQTIDLPQIDPKTDLVERRSTGGVKMDLTEADIIVTGGRGMRDPDKFDILENLAEVLGGVVGATRAAVDAGWRPHSDQVGQTGKTVSPNLYMMFGASGSIQHWAGMSGAKCIVAVNKDPNAPIIARADYSIIGDLFEVVPVLTEEIKKIRG
jgi:electron transfer flavoprotein alpha subunit